MVIGLAALRQLFTGSALQLEAVCRDRTQRGPVDFLD